MASTITCRSGCCSLFVNERVITEPQHYLEDTKHRVKPGALIVDSLDRVLLSQSYNVYWSIPKGSKEPPEDNKQTAVRETKEETGVDISIDDLSQGVVYIVHKNFYIVYDVTLPTQGPECCHDPLELDNETSGCGWIKIPCLYEMDKNKTIRLNYLTRLVLERKTNLKWTV